MDTHLRCVDSENQHDMTTRLEPEFFKRGGGSSGARNSAKVGSFGPQAWEYWLFTNKIWLTNIKVHTLFRRFISFSLMAAHMSAAEHHLLIDMGVHWPWLYPEIWGLSELKIWPLLDRKSWTCRIVLFKFKFHRKKIVYPF